MLKAGIIGCGRIVEQGHLPAFAQLGDRVQIVAIADPQSERRDTIGNLLDISPASRYCDYRDMLAKERLDFVDMALPHFLHEEAILAAAEHRINILTEKPLTTSIASANRIAEAVKRADIRMCVIHNYRYRPSAAKAIRLVQAGHIGKPFLIRSEGLGGGHYAGTASYDPDWRAKASRGGGGVLLDNGYHNIYMAEALMDSPIVQVYSRVGTFVQKQDVEDLATALMAHENGGTTSVQLSWGVKGGGKRVSEVHGTLGSIRFGTAPGEPALQLYENAVGEWITIEVDEAATNDFAGLFADFLTALETGGPVPVDVYQARHNLAIILAGYESSRRGQAVQVSEIEQDTAK